MEEGTVEGNLLSNECVRAFRIHSEKLAAIENTQNAEKWLNLGRKSMKASTFYTEVIVLRCAACALVSIAL